LTPGSFFYIEMWPPGQYSTVRGSFFSCRKLNQTINSTASRRKVTPVEYWPGVKFLRRKMTRGSNFYVEKWPPGVKFLRRKPTLKNDPGGQISMW
jgi:hypothetical protein